MYVFFCFRLRRPPVSKRTTTPLPSPPLFRSRRRPRSSRPHALHLPVSQLRLNPLTGRWVTLAADRATRPGDLTARRSGNEFDDGRPCPFCPGNERSEEHTSELQSLMRISYAVFCLKTKNKNTMTTTQKL